MTNVCNCITFSPVCSWHWSVVFHCLASHATAVRLITVRMLSEYEINAPYIGALVGRFANRIHKGTFTLDGETHQLAINNGPNCLHGGVIGFHKVDLQCVVT